MLVRNPTILNKIICTKLCLFKISGWNLENRLQMSYYASQPRILTVYVAITIILCAFLVSSLWFHVQPLVSFWISVSYRYRVICLNYEVIISKYNLTYLRLNSFLKGFYAYSKYVLGKRKLRKESRRVNEKRYLYNLEDFPRYFTFHAIFISESWCDI